MRPDPGSGAYKARLENETSAGQDPGIGTRKRSRLRKIAVVTGASSGMGREFVMQIGQAYASLDEIWVIARRREGLEEVLGEFYSEKMHCFQEERPHEQSLDPAGKCPRLRLMPLDLTREADMETLKEELRKNRPCVRILVNGAGVGHYGLSEELTVEEQLQMIDLNCRALTQVTLVCLPYLTKGSRILQLSSGSGFCPQPRFAVYAAGKAYVTSFSRALHRELKKRGITVTSVCPGPVDTDFFAHGNITLPAWKKPFLVKPEKVARKALFDAEAGRELSVYGLAMKLVRLGARFF